MHPTPRQGFTLIELSIVLVIIGLIIGGALVGRDMIEMAQARSMMSQMEKFQAATTTFRLKYNCKAGDCNNAIILGLSTRNGNGDGLNGNLYNSISSNATSWPICLAGNAIGLGSQRCVTNVTASGMSYITRSYGEHQLFWTHLSVAGLINDSIVENIAATDVDQKMGVTYPKDALNKNYIVAAGINNKFYLRSGLETVTASFGVTVVSKEGTLSAAQMQYITNKFDYPILVGLTGTHLTALASGQRIVPIKPMRTDRNSGFFYRSPEEESNFDSPACVISDGNGGYNYNIQNNGRCDVLWEIDY